MKTSCYLRPTYEGEGFLWLFEIMFRNASSISTTNSKSQNYPSENTRGHVEFCCNDTTTYCCSSKYVPPLLFMFIVRSSSTLTFAELFVPLHKMPPN